LIGARLKSGSAAEVVRHRRMAMIPRAATLARRCTGLLAVAAVLLGSALAGAQAATPPPQEPAPPQNVSAVPPVRPPAASVSIPVGIFTYAGRTVRDISFRGFTADPMVVAHLHSLVAQRPNQPLERQKVAASLRALYATGRFSDLQVEAQSLGPREVSLVFVASENLFIASITVEGAPKRPSATQLRDSSKLELGRLFTPAALENGLALMKSVLAANGYYRAQVTATEQRHPETQRIDVMFHVVPGIPARISEIAVEGDPGISAGDVRAISKLHPGDTVSMPKVTAGVQRLRKYYSKKDRLEAQIAVVDRSYHADSNTLNYTLRIVRGPTVDVHVEGASISKGKLRKFVPIYEEHAVDDDLLNEGRRNLRDYLQTKGYFDAQVDFARRPEPQENHVHIIYQVKRGPRHDLSSVVIDGNKYFDTSLIRELMSVQPATFVLTNGRYSQELLARDIQTIRALYVNNGFEKVEITSEVRDDYGGQKGRMAVFVHIKEGPQTLVGKLNIDGNQAITDDQLTPQLTTAEGQPYSEANVAQDRDTILNYYFNHGFPDVVFSARATPQGNRLMDVTYTIEEGPEVFVDRILFTGLEYTKPGVVRRQFQIAGRQPLSQSAMLDTQRRLYDLGVFNAVNMAVQNPDGQAKYKDVFLQFEEAKRWTFNYGFGIEVQSGTFGTQQTPQGTPGVSPRVSFDVTRLNFGGRAHTLSLQSHVGRLQQRGVISYEAPRFLNHESVRLTFSAFYDNSVDVRTFTSQRLEGSAQLEQIVSKATSLLYRYTYRRVRATNLAVSPQDIPLFSQPVRVGMPSITYIRDRRDDPIDSRKGSFNTFDTGVAAGFFGSEAAFGRFLGQNTTYHPFLKKRWVFARSLRLGLAESFGQTDFLPLPERFFAGGGSSLRGFAINQAGPRDLQTGQPLGGNAMIINNFELRTPTVPLPLLGNTLSFVLFHDAGNVFTNSTEMWHSLTSWSQPKPDLCKSAATYTQCRFNYISHALGTGIRYRTPIGPVRLDVGYNLNPPVFPVATTDPISKLPVFNHFETLRHFNFYFSIGQTF
jgi:outer membrane protein insertion porin family